MRALLRRNSSSNLQEPIDRADIDAVVGRTRDGHVFHIPPVQPLVHSLLFPLCIFDWSIILLVATTLFVFLFTSVRKEFFLLLFVFWRIGYNLVLGVLLRLQSDHNILVRYAKRFGFGRNAGKKRGPWQASIIRELLKKLEIDEVEFNNLPVEFTTWILFRALVDTVLVNDFLSHSLFAAAYFKFPVLEDSGPELFGISWRDWLRYCTGAVLLLINYGIKIEGNRSVSDYAWYWGDFFFFQTSESSADSPITPPPPPAAFELAPHPMYSVGYIGFYALALIAKSYTVFFVSLAAHITQIAFFFFVESRHFERTYGSPNGDGAFAEGLQGLFRRDLVVVKNFDPFRSTDVLTALVWILTLVNSFVVGRVGDDHENNWKVWQAIFWRFIYSGVLGFLLHLQSKQMFWSRHFIKFGETSADAFKHWKIIYNLSQSMTYVSFYVCALMLYRRPENWFVGSVMFKHTLAVILIFVHVWTTFSIHRTLGEYGWFFGDFFIDSFRSLSNSSLQPSSSPPQSDFAHRINAPTYTGLYRFLNHPNAWAASASTWGVAVMTGSWHLLVVAGFTQICGWCFVFLVEAPHMRRRYGDLVRSQTLVDDLVGMSAVAGVPVIAASVGMSPRAVHAEDAVYVRTTLRGVGRGGGGVGAVRGVRRRGVGSSPGQKRMPSDAGLGIVDSQLYGTQSWASSFRSSETWLRNESHSGLSSMSFESDRAKLSRDFRDDDDHDMDDGLVMKPQAVLTWADSVDDEHSRHTGAGSDGDDENDDENLTTRVQSPLGIVRSVSNPSRFSKLSSVERLSSSLDNYIPPKKSSSFRSYTDSDSGLSKVNSGSLRQIKSFTATVVQGAVNQAKPQVDKIVKGARNMVKSNVVKLAGSHWSQTQRLPRHLYTLSFPAFNNPTFSNSNVPRFKLGTPISIQFTCARETLKRRDWIGIYAVGENLSAEVTTSKSYSRWMFLTATVTNDDDETTPLMTKIPAGYRQPPGDSEDASGDNCQPALRKDQTLLFGNTLVTVRPSDEDEGLRVVTGTLLFSRSKIPWKVGTYEARYHHDGRYSVIAISKPFEIVAECFAWNEEVSREPLSETNESEIERIESFLRVHVERCVDIDVSKGDNPLDVNDDILSRVVMDAWIDDLKQFNEYKEGVAKRIVYGVKEMFGIEFSWHVIGSMRTVKVLSRKILEAKQALSPSPPPTDPFLSDAL
ncbi:phosphatidylethanolamine N-methyltransferase [Entophlyctis sp. JEL0112]|nr:phosphatidylethanolamine N-methyltransferase [Entophlyctis sp. JEL0112]